MKNICQKNGLSKIEMKIPKFYSIEYENFQKFYQTLKNICQKNGLSKIEI